MRLPEDYVETDELMSNFDHQIDRAVEEELKNGRKFAGYPGLNFYGKVWWTGKIWACEVWRYGSYRETVTAETLEELKEDICMEYGYE